MGCTSECVGVERPTQGGVSRLLQVCEPMYLTGYGSVGTSECVRARVSVDIGLCVKTVREKQVRVGVHTPVDAGKVCWEKVLVPTPAGETEMGTRGHCLGSSVRTPPSFLLPD